MADLFAAIQKELGDENVFKGDDIRMGSVVKYGVSSGLPKLDLFLGRRGGFPAGKIIEFYGFERSGKTTAALHAAKEWQKKGGCVMFIDTEKAFEPRRARRIGLEVDDTDKFIKSEADTVEMVFDHIMTTLDVLEKQKFDRPFLFIVDSVNGVPTQADAEGNIDANDRVGYEAKQIKRGCRKLNPRLDALKCQPSVIFINHAVTRMVSFGKRSDSGGGHGIKFYASVRVEFAHLGFITEGTEKRRTGQKIKLSIEKLKGGEIEFNSLEAACTNASGFDQYDGLYEAMKSSSFLDQPKSSRAMIILPGTGYEARVPNDGFKDWVESQGGYYKVYGNWRKWCIGRGLIIPWGGKA